MLPLDRLRRLVHDQRGAVRGGRVRRDAGHDRGVDGDVSMTGLQYDVTDTVQLATYAIELPKYQSRILMHGGSVGINCIRPIPNRWIRFWYRVLLEWRWERVE